MSLGEQLPQSVFPGEQLPQSVSLGRQLPQSVSLGITLVEGEPKLEPVQLQSHDFSSRARSPVPQMRNGIGIRYGCSGIFRNGIIVTDGRSFDISSAFVFSWLGDWSRSGDGGCNSGYG